MNKIIITGTSRGIGNTIAKNLLKHNVIVIGISRKHTIKHKNYFAISFDLNDLNNIKNILDDIIFNHKKIDAIISNAGYGLFENLENLKEKEVIDFFNVNLLAHILISKILVSHFKKKKTGHFIFIGSDLGLFIYDKNNNNLYEQESFGYTDSEFEFSSFQFNYTALASFRNEVFFANEESVIKLNLTSRKWSKVLGSEIFGGITINALAVNRSYLFLATDNALLQYHLKDKLVEVFNYEFLGNINTLEIDRSNLLIGTSEGIVSFLYK